jgi:hypothetical protein
MESSKSRRMESGSSNSITNNKDIRGNGVLAAAKILEAASILGVARIVAARAVVKEQEQQRYY